MHKRITKELSDIIPNRFSVQNLHYEAIRTDNAIPSELTIVDVINNNSKITILQIQVPNNYPFKPPSVTYFQYNNHMSYNKLLGTYSTNQKYGVNVLFAALFFSLCYNPHLYKTTIFRELLAKNTCFCCSSITCSNNWHPGLVLSDIVKEYSLCKIFKKYRSHVYLRIFDNLFHKKDCNFPDDIIIMILEKLGDPIDNNIQKLCELYLTKL